jgi:hypothetical protein
MRRGYECKASCIGCMWLVPIGLPIMRCIASEVRLQRDTASFLLFMSDFRVPFTNNGSEQDLRMVKVQQKISGTFHSQTGPVAFCRIRGYFSTLAKQGYRLCLIARQIWASVPLSPLIGL